MGCKLSAKLVSLFLISSICLLGYTAINTWSAPVPTAGYVAISELVPIRQGENVTYYFANDDLIRSLEVTDSYIELDRLVKISTEIICPVNVTIGEHIFSERSYIWHLSTNGTVNMSFTVSGLEYAGLYRVYVDGALFHTSRVWGDSITFNYSGPWSEHEFEVRTIYGPEVIRMGAMIGILIALGILVSILVPVVQVAQEKRKFKVDDLIQMVIYIVVSVSLIGLVYALLP